MYRNVEELLLERVMKVEGDLCHFTAPHFQAQHSPNLENLNMSIILVGHFQIANSNPETLKNTPDIEVFVSTSGRFRSFRCLTSKSIGFRQKQANTTPRNPVFSSRF